MIKNAVENGVSRGCYSSNARQKANLRVFPHIQAKDGGAHFVNEALTTG